MSEEGFVDLSKDILTEKLIKNEKIIRDLNCQIDSLETLLSVYRVKESSERKPSREENSSILSSTGRSFTEKEEIHENNEEIQRVLSNIPEDCHPSISKFKGLFKSLIRETNELRNDNQQLKSNLEKMVAKRPKSDSDNSQIILNLRAENENLREELNNLRTPTKKAEDFPIGISEFKQGGDMGTDEFLDFDFQSAHISSISTDKIDEQLKRFQKNIDAITAMKNSVQLNFKQTHSSVTASADNLDAVSHCSPVLNFGLQSLIDNLRGSITIDNSMTGSVIIHPGIKNYESNIMIRIEEEDKREEDSGKASVMSKIRESTDTKLEKKEVEKLFVSEIINQNNNNSGNTNTARKSYDIGDKDTGDIVNVEEDDLLKQKDKDIPPYVMAANNQKTYKEDLSDLLKKNIEKIFETCKHNQALLAESCHSLEVNSTEIAEKQKTYTNETVQNVLSDRTNKLLDESNEQNNKSSPSFKFFRKVIKEITSVFKKKNKQILDELATQMNINENLKKHNKEAYDSMVQMLELINHDLVTLNGYIYQNEEVLQKLEALENKVIVNEEEINFLRNENEKMYKENERREKIIEDVIVSFEAELTEQGDVKKSQEKLRYMNYKDNFDKLKIVSEKILEIFLNKEAGNDFGKKNAIREYRNKIKTLQQETEKINAQSEQIKTENQGLKESINSLEKKYLAANKSLDEFISTFSTLQTSCSNLFQSFNEI